MPKTGRAPEGYYSASQVMRKLGIASSTLYHFVDTGKIKRIVPPNMRDGFYVKEEIDKMAKERELFILTYMKTSSEYGKADKGDIMGIYEVCTSLWGERTASYDSRLKSFQKNPSIYYVVKKEGIVIGFVGLIPFHQEALNILMTEAQTNFYRVYDELLGEPDNILPFVAGQPIKSLFLDMAVKKGIPKGEIYGMRLIQGSLNTIETFAQQGTPVEKLHASSSSPDGIKLCRDLGFTEIPIGETTRRGFVLDLATSSVLQLEGYRKLLKGTERTQKASSPSIHNAKN